MEFKKKKKKKEKKLCPSSFYFLIRFLACFFPLAVLILMREQLADEQLPVDLWSREKKETGHVHTASIQKKSLKRNRALSFYFLFFRLPLDYAQNSSSTSSWMFVVFSTEKDDDD